MEVELNSMPTAQRQAAGAGENLMPTGRTPVGILSRVRAALMPLPLVLLDVVVLAGAMAGARWLTLAFIEGGLASFGKQWLPLLAIGAVIFPCCRVYAIAGVHPIRESRRRMIAVTASFALLLIANMTLATLQPVEMLWLSLAWAGALAAGLPLQTMLRVRLAKLAWWGERVLVVGEPAHARAVRDELTKRAYLGMKPVCLVTDKEFHTNEGVLRRIDAAHDWPADGGRAEHAPTAPAARLADISCVLVATGKLSEEEVRDLIIRCAPIAGKLVVVPRADSLPTLWSTTHDYGGMIGVHARTRLVSPLRGIAKRCFDLAVVLAATPLLLPIVAVICLMIKWGSPGPIIFGHERVGRNGRRFRAWKFRTMVPNADAVLAETLAADAELQAEWDRDQKLRKDPRVIPGIGSLLRKLSLDELPQLWNVLCGEMSLVGPRPIVSDEIGKYEHVYPLYSHVLPGITGLWQISGRNNTTYRERIDLDSYYVRNWSPWLDFCILLRTVKTVLWREGAY